MKINTHILGLLVVVGLFSLQSCDDESYDIEGSNQNYVYINVNRWTSTEYPQNTFVYEVLRTPIGSSLESGPEIVKVGVRSTKVASKDITVTLDIDNCASIGEFSSFPDGVKYALRQDPDVILIGEIRDIETLSSAMKAAETGHLVIASLHTNDAIQTVSRIVGMYEPQDRANVRKQLAGTLKACVAQKLLPLKSGHGRIPACEIMVVTPTIKDFIIKDELEQIYDLVKKGSYNDMITMNMSLLQLIKEDLITKDTALDVSDNKVEIQQMLRGAYHGTTESFDIQF